MTVREFVCTHYERHRKFFIYSWTGLIFTIANIVLLYVFIDIMRIPTLISSTVIVGGLFILKYFFYRWAGFA